MSEKVASSQPRRRSTNSSSRGTPDTKAQGKKDRKPHGVDTSQNGRPLPDRDRGAGRGGRRDSDVDRVGRHGRRDTEDHDIRRDKPLSAKAESYRPIVLKPESNRGDRERGKEGGDKIARGIPAASSTSVESTTTARITSSLSGVVGQNEPVKVHFGVIRGMPYEFTSNSTAVTPRDMKKYGRKLFADNSQLSILVRRVLQEDDRERERRLNALKNLKEFLNKSENARDVYKQTDSLLLVLHQVLQESRSQKDMKSEVAQSISILGWQLRFEGRRFFSWIFGKLEAATIDDTKMFLLHAVAQTLSQDTTHYYKLQIPSLMTNLQTALENAEVPIVLLSVMSVIHHIAEKYPDIFVNNFKDTVDILVGWHIDTTQSASMIKYCSDSLISFHQFWLSDMEFSTTLLGQFLEDMNAYAEDLLQGSDNGSMSGSGDKGSPDDDIPAPDVCKAKILALLRVFTTVVKSLGDEFTPLHGPPITFNYLSKLFVDIVDCIEMVQKEMADDMSITMTGNQCLSVMCDCVQHQLGKFEHSIVPYVLRQLDIFMKDDYPKTQHLLSPLELLFKAIYYMRASFPKDIATSLLGPQSKLRQLRFKPNKEVLAVVLRVYQSLLCVKDIPMLENVYSLLLADLEVAYNTLLDRANSPVTVELATDNPFSGTELTILEAKTIAMFDLNAFMDIASAKSSIIGMWALSPSLFELLSKHLIPVHIPLAEQFPAVHYTLLNTLFAHAQSHGHFISSAFGIASPSSKIPAIATTSPKTSGHFSTLLTILGEILPHPKVSGDSRKLCMRWLSQILKLPQLRDYSTLYEHSAFTSAIEALLPLAHNPDHDVCLAACTLMQQVLRAVQPPVDFLIGCVEICKTKLVDSSEKVAKAYAALLELIPADILLRNELSPLTLAKRLADQNHTSVAGSSEIDPLGLQVVRLSRCSHINRPLGTFHPHDFKKVMAYILLGEEPSDPDWLARMYHSCQKSETRGVPRSSDIALSHYIDSNRALQWFWATWEAAQMCVLLKLRTPLGKPQETFRAIENALLEYCRDTKTGDSKCQAHGPTCQAFSPEYTKAQIRPVLLLQFLEHLEKLMYNAYEGSAMAMTTAPKVVRTFFRTNRVTCQDWLRTMRPIAATAASNVGQHAVAIRHGLEMIKDLVNKGNTQSQYFEDAMQRVVSSCVHLHCPQPIMGILSWCQETVGRTLAWVVACIPAAERKYENCAAETVHAIKKYLTLEEIPNYPLPPKPKSIMTLKESPPESPKFKGHAPPDGVQTRLLTRNNVKDTTAELNNNVYSHLVAEYLLNQVTQCYISVSDWSSAMKWQQAAVEIRSHVPNQKHIELTHDMNAIRALSKFEDREFKEVAKHLDLIPGLSLEGLNPDSIPVMNDDVADLEAVLDRGLFEFVRALTHFHLSGCYQAPVSLLSDGSTFIHPALSAVIKMLQTAHQMGVCGVQTAWLDWPSYPNQGHTVLMQSAKALINAINSYHEEGFIPLSSDLKLDPALHDTKVIGRATQVMKYQYYLQSQVAEDNTLILDIQHQLMNLQLATAQLARKQGNLSFAKKLLCDQIQLLSPSQDGAELFTSQGLEIKNSREKADKSLMSALKSFKKTGERTMKAFHLERECAKLTLAMGNNTDAWAAMAVCAVDYATHVNASLNSSINMDEVSALSNYTSRSLLNLVKWFQTDYRSAIAHVKQARASDATDKSPLANSLNVLLDMEHDGVIQRLGLAACGEGESAEVVGSSPAISENDAACGRLLHLAVMQAPELAKAWATLASWCYRWGRKAVDIASSDGGVQLTEEEKSEVLSVLPVGITNSEMDGILEILSQAHCSASTIQEEDVIEQMQSAYHDGRETTRMQLKSSCPALHSVEPRVVDQLLEVWNRVCRRIFSHYRLAARGYFTFLKLTGGTSRDKTSNNNALKPPSSLEDSMQQESVESQATREDGNITATLRLLRLLVKYAGELRDVLEDGLANTPTAPWKSIIPQLFSRLNHPEAYVRQSISDLMCRVAVDSPHLIVYQAVVGSPTSSDHKKNKDVVQQSMLTKLLTSPSKENMARARAEGDQLQNQPENPQDLEKSIEEEERNRSMSMLEDCLQAIVATLSKHNNTLVCQVEVLVQELRRITVLWEELWLGTLTQLHVDVTRRLHQLEDEVKRVKNNESLSGEEKELIIAEKHNAIMKPIVYALEQVHSITSQTSETPNEKNFQESFQATIEKALSALRTPKDPSHPMTSWTLFKQLQGTLQQRATKRATFMLQMSDISPRLSAMKDTIIPLPGLVCPPSQVMNIHSFAESVNILPTKTKPKKLVFIGQDSKRYTYLFKGLEDLHLDERIMQFLAIVNTMFAKNKRQDASLYHACHYSVTPLGPRSGLIQWVDGATALFGLYKRWQQREANAAAVAKGANSNVQPPVARPSEVFYGKMTPALKDAGLSDQSSRKDWPMAVMKDVLKDLMAETPGDLLAKELWCSSGSASEWWYVTQAYSRSTAVMSIIGYIIGLGDRHMDNVLVNFLTGDVVHIDYNVCFEKGKNLRVPERVPFRMTQNIETALGVTGVEGTFRQTAEEVLKIMRKGRETLLTLLEAFVYDPLVDWTTGNEGGFASAFYGGGQMNPVVADGGEKKREMEKEITRSLFSSRVAEMKAPWFKNRDAILAEIKKLEDILKAYLNTIGKSKALEETTEQHKKQSQILQVALGDKHHELHTLGTRYSEVSKLQSTRKSVLTAIQDKLRELEHWHAQHTVALETARGQHLTAIQKEMEHPLELGGGPYVPVVQFLKTAGQMQVISQCEHVENELCSLIHQRRALLIGCVDVLQAYCQLAQQFPMKFAEMNRAYIWQQWLQELICDFTADKCDEIIDRYQDEFSPPDPNHMQQVITVELKLQGLAGDANSRLVKAMDTLKQEQTDRPHAEASAQQYEAQINQYIQENGDSGSITLLAVIMNMMSSFCKRSLIMEGAVASAGDLLVDFTTRNGNWFLEELCSMINNLDNFFKFIYFCSFPTTFDVAQVFKAVDCFRSLKNVYSQLQELHSQFKTVLTPLVIKSIQSEEPSVTHILKSFNDLCQNPELPLQKVAYQIEQDLATVTLGMQTELTSSQPVQLLRSRFASLIEPAMSTSSSPSKSTKRPLSTGQSLLAACNAVFQQLLGSVMQFVSQMEDLHVPAEWRRVDVIQDAKGLKATVLNSNTQALLMDMFFVKQLQALNEFFLLCRCYAAASKGDQDECNKLNTLLTGQQGSPEITALLFTESQLVQPIKKFLAHYIRKQILGIATQVICLCACTFAHQLGLDTVAAINVIDIGANSKYSIDVLIKKAVEVSIQKGLVQSHLYSLLNNITSSYDTAWRAADQARLLATAAGIAKEVCHRAQNQLVRYQWLHEDVLQQAGHQRQNAPFQNPPRSSVMSDLRKRVQLLVSLEGAITAVKERSTSLHASISQRLKWASGANPSLNAVLQRFDDAVNERNKVYAIENKHSTEVSALSNAILHFEALRTRTTEARNAESNFLSLLNRTLESCEAIESSTATVSEAEEGFIRLKPPTPDQPINHKWMRQVLDILKKKVKERDKKAEEQKLMVQCGKDALHTQVDTVKNTLGTHHKLMSEVKGLLKTIARGEEEEEQTADGEEGTTGDVRTFMMAYRSFSEEFTNMLKVLVVGSSEEDIEKVLTLADMITKIQDQGEHTKRLYEHLVSLADPLLSKLNEEDEKKNRAETERKESSGDVAENSGKDSTTGSKTGSPTRPPPGFAKLAEGTPATPPTGTKPAASSSSKVPQAVRDPRTGKMLQVRNTHAINVWRRVKGKLDGRDPDPLKRLTVAEQIDFVIKEATSMENLATLYEGWTAWV